MRVVPESSNPFGGTSSQAGETESAFEQHFTPQEIADLWKRDPGTIRRMFRYEEGVIVDGLEDRSDGKRDYVTLRIPRSVVERVHDRLRNKSVGRFRIRHRRISEGGAGELQQDVISPVASTLQLHGHDLSDAAWEQEVQRTVEGFKAAISRNKTQAK